MSEPKRRVLPVLVTTAFAVAMLAPMLFLGKIIHFRDFGRFYRPVKALYLDRLLAGEFPIWMPEFNLGTPIHGELVHALLYPGNVFLLAGGTVGWGLYFTFHLVLAGLSTRALARRLGAGEPGALLAGLAFAGSGYLVAQMNHVPYMTTAAWSPLVILLGLSTAAGRRGAMPLLVLAFTMAALASEPFSLILTIALLLVLVLSGVADARRLAGLVKIGLAGMIAILLATPVLLPAAETFSQSIRAGGSPQEIFGYGSLHPLRLTTLFVPESCGRLQQTLIRSHQFLGMNIVLPYPILLGAHLGAVPLILMLFAPFRRSRPALVLGIVAVVTLVLALGDYVGLANLLTDFVPGLDAFRYPHKYWLLTTLSVAILAGLAVDRTRWTTSVIAAIGAVVAVLLGALLGNRVAGLISAVPFVLVALATWSPPRLRIGLLTGVLAAELLFFGHRVNVSSDLESMSPMSGIGAPLAELHPGRIYAEFTYPKEEESRRAGELSVLLARSLESVTGIAEGFNYSRGYDPIEPIRRVSEYFITHADLPPEDVAPVFHRILRLVGNTHSVTNADMSGDSAMREVLEGEDGIRAFEYVEPAPRARLYWSVRFVEDAEEARSLLRDLEFDPFRTLIVEGDSAAEPPVEPGGFAQIIETSSRRVLVRTRSERDAWLFLADTNAPGWRATVDGKAAQIHHALIAFRAVRVPAGIAQVEFQYEPDWLRTAPWTFGLGALLLLVLALGTGALRKGVRPLSRGWLRSRAASS